MTEKRKRSQGVQAPKIFRPTKLLNLFPYIEHLTVGVHHSSRRVCVTLF